MVSQQPTDAMSPRALAAVSVQILRATQAGNSEEAVRVALDHLPHASDLPRLAQVSLLALMKANRKEAATRLVKDVVKKGMTTPEVAVLAIRHLRESHRADEAYAYAKKVMDGTDKPDPRLAEAAARAALAAYRPLEEAFEFLERAKDQAGDDGVFLRAYGEVCLSLGRYAEAEEVLARTLALAPKVVNTRLLYARALKHLHRFDDACAQMLAIVEQDPSPTNKRYAVAMLLQVGREDEASKLYYEMVGERKARLQGSFVAEMGTLDGRVRDVKLPQKRLDWAWAVVSRTLGSPPARDRADWDRRAKWGHLLDNAIVDWLECSIEQAGEIHDCFNLSEDTKRIILDASDEGKGVLLASAHIGLMFAGPVAIHSLGRPYRWLSSTPRITTTRFVDTLISTADLSEAQVARRVYEALQKGCLIAIAVDGAMSPNAPRIEWEGAPVTYSPFCALLSYKFGVPTVFTSPYWANGKFNFAVKRLPDVKPDESLQQFAERWQRAFFEEVKNVFLQGPENLRLNGGLWRHI
ncbi:tetratricopeptide repeat protein [Labrys sp. KNU-23]|uniref:tetratricopeptide repeat protein n=1 Tax=Labrys sp. KNU-23 TaxID=2789216 RepID=UPI0011EE858A|nr:tetratricopeptide repeat protein [Labrys sp. KNU-23]QEN85059.1 tetratricopeptide repeat protein [Labrys sp. KNU-23]